MINDCGVFNLWHVCHVPRALLEADAILIMVAWKISVKYLQVYFLSDDWSPFD